MKIQLESPFLNDYKAAYVNTNIEPRRVCLMVKNDGSKTSMSYARYLMSCHLNRILGKDEEVDHIDGDKMNDVVSNYQILSKADNIRKSRPLKKTMQLLCPICGGLFIRATNRVKHKINQTCSRKCGGIKSHKLLIL